MTKIIDFKNDINKDELDCIRKSFLNGKLVIFPTETVYGIGADARNEEAVSNIFKAKGRAQDNPLIVHISNFNMLNKIVKRPNNIEQLLIDNFMPGPFTLILKKKKVIPDIVTCGLDTVGIRYPDNDITKTIIEYTNLPIAAPSANISSRPSGTNIKDIIEDFKDKVDIIIDGGSSKIGLESTVCKVIDGIPTILRPGKITPEDIKKVTGVVAIDKHVFKNTSKNKLIESPGMKYKHYAPNTTSILIYGKNLQDYIDLVNIHKKNKTSIIGFIEHENYFKDYKFHNVGSINNLDEVAKNIFTTLREADKDNSDLIIIEGVEKKGLGIAIMNRLLRSCSFNYYEK